MIICILYRQVSVINTVICDFISFLYLSCKLTTYCNKVRIIRSSDIVTFIMYCVSLKQLSALQNLIHCTSWPKPFFPLVAEFKRYTICRRFALLYSITNRCTEAENGQPRFICSCSIFHSSVSIKSFGIPAWFANLRANFPGS